MFRWCRRPLPPRQTSKEFESGYYACKRKKPYKTAASLIVQPTDPEGTGSYMPPLPDWPSTDYPQSNLFVVPNDIIIRTRWTPGPAPATGVFVRAMTIRRQLAKGTAVGLVLCFLAVLVMAMGLFSPAFAAD